MAGAYREAGLSPDKLKEVVKQVRGTQKVDSRSAEEGYDALSKYARNLIADAEAGKLDPVIGSVCVVSNSIWIPWFNFCVCR